MRLIDADALKLALRKLPRDGQAALLYHQKVINTINNMPTATVWHDAKTDPPKKGHHQYLVARKPYSIHSPKPYTYKLIGATIRDSGEVTWWDFDDEYMEEFVTDCEYWIDFPDAPIKTEVSNDDGCERL